MHFDIFPVKALHSKCISFIHGRNPCVGVVLILSVLLTLASNSTADNEFAECIDEFKDDCLYAELNASESTY